MGPLKYEYILCALAPIDLTILIHFIVTYCLNYYNLESDRF